MIDFSIFSYTFIQYAALAGLCVSILAGILGPMVVASKQSVTSDILAHVALAGIGFAAFASIEPLWGALCVLLIGSVLLWRMITSEQYAMDALSMLFLSGGLSLALAFVHAAKNKNVVLDQYLFGSILTVTSAELMSMITLTSIVLFLVWRFWYPLLGAVHMPAYKIPYVHTPQLIQLLFFIMLASTVWVGIKTVGGLLVGALLVLPTLIVHPFVQSFFKITIWATIIALCSTISGLLLSVLFDIPPSSLIIFVLIGFFIASNTARTIARAIRAQKNI